MINNQPTTQIKPNANFHSLTKKTVFDVQNNDKFLEYRRRWYEFPTHFIAGAFPIHLDIESTNACNLYCPFCATTYKNWGPYKKGFLDFSLFKRVIDEGVDNGLYSTKLSFRGEPLLHPYIAEMVAYAKKKGIIDIYFNTNATVLDENKINQLIDAGLDRISISFEGTGKEVYERYRIGAQYEITVNNIRKLRDIRDKRGALHPQVRIQTVLFPGLKETFSQYVDFWKDIADEVGYVDARHEKPTDDHKGYIADWACPFLWQRMVVLWEGTLLPCLMHGISDFNLMSLGNIEDVSIKEIWRGQRVCEYRKLHRKGATHKLQACDCCSYRAMELEKQGIKKERRG